ncbi:MAG: SDR family NAD(P)-dependent oxidoreductase [Jatrophihabitans sp.]
MRDAGEQRRLRPPPEPGSPSALPQAHGQPLFGSRVAVVTGAALGIGAGIARALAHHGAQLLLIDIDGAAARATAERIVADGGHAPTVLVADVTVPETADTVRKRAEELGGASLLVNNVGDYRPAGLFVTSTPGDWQRTYELNFGHLLHVTHALLPAMMDRGHGAILNVSSVEGFRGIPGNAVYGAMKAAVISFTASLAAEVGQHGIRVNAIAPDLTDTPQTPMWDSVDERYADHVGKWVPAGRFGHPRDHGDAAVFLLSDQAAWVTGETLRVDGGTFAAPGWHRRDESHFTNMPRRLR